MLYYRNEMKCAKCINLEKEVLLCEDGGKWQKLSYQCAIPEKKWSFNIEEEIQPCLEAGCVNFNRHVYERQLCNQRVDMHRANKAAENCRFFSEKEYEQMMLF